MKRNVLKFIIFFGASAALVLIDQLTKMLAYEKLFNNEPVPIINGILELVYVENRGAAFGILQNKQILFYILTVIVLIVIFFYVSKINLSYHYVPFFIFLIFIFSGAIGNFIDRVKNKYVIDFIYFKPIDFPVFNFADICITIGCILLIFSLIFVYKGEDI